jgi:hypothetical protein
MRIQAFDYSIDLLQAILWQYNDAAKLQSLLEQKQEWYDEQYSAFWEDWYRDVFDLRTANDFGLSVWAILLNIPLTITSGQAPSTNLWGFGPYPNFSRASPGALYDEDGLLISVGNDVPRYGYDPETLQYIGLLYEAAATNLFTRSEVFTAPWAGSNITAVTPNVITAPDGTLTADKLIPNATNTTHYVEDATALIGVADNALYSYSIYVRQAEYNRVAFSMVPKNGGAGGNCEFRFSDERFTQTIQGVNQSGITFAFDKLPGGWYRIKVGGVSMTTGATVPRMRVFPSNDLGVGSTLWAKTATVGAITATPSPVAGWTVDSLIEDSTTNNHYANTSLNIRNGKSFTCESYLAPLGAGATRYGGIYFTTSAWNGNVLQGVLIDLTNGAILATAGGLGAYVVTPSTGGFWKISATFTPIATIQATMRVFISNTPASVAPSYLGDGVSGMLVAAPYAYETVRDRTYGLLNSSGASFAGDTVKGVYIWGAQVEAGTSVTSYIKTTGATATRAADIQTANTGGFRKNFNRGNFAPSTSGIKLTTAQKRLVLRLRYFQLVTRGAIPEINQFLNYVFTDFGKVYVLDGLDMTINYVFTFLPPSQLRFVLESFDVLPRPAAVGVNYVVLVRDTFGFGPFHTNFNRGNFGSN